MREEKKHHNYPVQLVLRRYIIVHESVDVGGFVFLGVLSLCVCVSEAAPDIPLESSPNCDSDMNTGPGFVDIYLRMYGFYARCLCRTQEPCINAERKNKKGRQGEEVKCWDKYIRRYNDSER